MTLNLIPWWAYLAAGAMAGALLAGGIQQARVSSAQTGLAQVREQHAQAVADAALAKAAAHARALEIERELTARTQALQATIDKQDQDARNAQAQHAADRAAATAAAGRLRERLATITRAASAGARVAADSGACSSAQRKTGALAGLLAEADSLAEESSGIADDAIRRGLACEAAYGAVREELSRKR